VKERTKSDTACGEIAGRAMSGIPRIIGGVGREPMTGARGGKDCDSAPPPDGPVSPAKPRPDFDVGRGIAIGLDLAVGLGSADTPDFPAECVVGIRVGLVDMVKLRVERVLTPWKP
jgi:hypothetical protein